MLDGKHVLILRKVLFDVSMDILEKEGEFTEEDERIVKACDAFFTEYPTLGQLERDGKL
jgi:hypothetical protein